MLVEYLADSENLEVGHASETSIQWLLSFNIPKGLVDVLTLQWIKESSDVQFLVLYSLDEISARQGIEHYIDYKLLEIGYGSNGDPIVADWSDKNFPIGFIEHETYWSKEVANPRHHLELAFRSLDSFLHKMFKKDFVPYDFESARMYNELLREEYSHEPFPPFRKKS